MTPEQSASIDDIRAQNPHKRYSLAWSHWNSHAGTYGWQSIEALEIKLAEVEARANTAWLNLGMSGQLALDGEVRAMQDIIRTKKAQGGQQHD